MAKAESTEIKVHSLSWYPDILLCMELYWILVFAQMKLTCAFDCHGNHFTHLSLFFSFNIWLFT